MLGQTVPVVPFDQYGDSLLGFLAQVVVTVFPYAAAVTAVAIGLLLVKRWLGHASATSLVGTSSATSSQRDYCNYDCYDAGGCDGCSTWHEWHDRDYGLVGEWRRR